MTSKLSEFKKSRSNLNHKNNMPKKVRTIGIEVAKTLHTVMNKCQIADTMDVHEKTVRRWLKN